MLFAVLSLAMAPPVVTVLPLSGDASEVTDELRAAATALGFNVQSKQTTADHLAAAAALNLTCPLDDVGCMLKIGGLSSADLVIGGRAKVDGDHIKLVVRAFDIAAVAERGNATVSLAGDARARVLDVKRIAVDLLAPDKDRGSIAITSRPTGAAVYVDKLPHGTAPVTVDVKPGAHEVYVAKPGFDSVVQQVTVAFEGDAHVDAELKPGTPAPPPSFAPPPVANDDAPKKRFIRIAVYELEATGVEPRAARLVTQAVLAEIRKLQGVSVIGVDEIKAMLDHEANRQLAGCDVDQSCLADIAGALGADVVVVGGLTHVGDENVFGMKRLDQKTAQTTKQIALRLKPAGGEEFVAAIGPAVEQLFPDLPLQPGQKRGAPPELALRVHPPPLSPAVFWTTSGAAGVAAAVSAGALALNLGAKLSADALSSQPALSGAELTRNRRTQFAAGDVAWASLGVSLVVGAAAGVESLFVDWWGYGDTK